MGMLLGGGFTAWTLGALADGTDGQHLVERLTTAGLLEPATIDATGEPRYRPHDLIALYAQELAAAADPALTREAIGRLLETLISVAQTIHPRASQFLEALPSEEPCVVSTGSPHTAATVDPNTWIHTERRLLLTTIEQACRVGHYRQAALLATLTIPTLAGLGGFPQLHQTLTTIHEAALKHGDERLAWRAEYGRATLALTSDLHEATAAFARSTQAFQRLNAPTELAYSLAGLAFARSLHDVPDEESAQRAVRIARTTDQPALKALAQRSHADVLVNGRPEHARPLYEKALEHGRELSTPEVESDILLRYGRCLLALGDLENATTACDAAIKLITGQHNLNSLAWCLGLRSRIHLHLGNHRDALQTAQHARILMTQTGDTRGSATVSLDLAAAHLAADEPAKAANVLKQAIPALDDTGSHHAATQAKQLLQRLHGGKT